MVYECSCNEYIWVLSKQCNLIVSNGSKKCRQNFWVSKSEQVLEKDEVVEFERVWVVNEDNEVVLKKNTKHIQKVSKPKIHYTRKKNKVQIWSEDKIEYVLVNGKRVQIEKDVVGHDFVEISLKKKKTSIEVKTKHRKVLKKEEIKRSAVRITSIQKIRMWLKQIFKL